MINVNELWKRRFIQNSNETRKYLRYMLNDHLLFVLLFMVGGVAYNYKNWVESLPSHFPFLFVLTFVLAIVITNSPIRTFLKEADIAFLLPIEAKLAAYFKRSIMYSFMMQTYWILIAFVALLPIYNRFIHKGFLAIFLTFIILVMIKFWNLTLAWDIQFYPDIKAHLCDRIVRFTLNFIFIYFLLAGANIVFLLVTGVIMLLVHYYFHKATRNKTLKWNFLIEQEAKRMMLFYRVANLFTDVPKLRNRVKRRKWLDVVLTFIHYTKKNTYPYLYLRTFLRTSDYLGLFVRLTIIGGLALYFAPFYYGKLIITVLFIYLTGFQLTTLWKHHDGKIWVTLYPITIQNRLKSFLALLQTLLIIQTLLLSAFLLATSQFILTGLSIIVGICFCWVFVHVYLQKKIKKLT